MPQLSSKMDHFLQSNLLATILITLNEIKLIGSNSFNKAYFHTTNVTNDIKYVLRWQKKLYSPFEFLEKNNIAFIKNSCKFTNCYITDNKNLLEIQKFDAIIFNAVDIGSVTPRKVPSRRSPKQKYIFAAMESAHIYPVCAAHFDSFFNWTWTYKLDSNFRWRYLAIYDLKGKEVGPEIDMHWHHTMEPIDDRLKKKLSGKTKAAAWFVSNCRARSLRHVFVNQVRKELRKFNLTVDVYGKCGQYACPREYKYKCSELLRKEYFFYFAFENSFAEDYVTEKLLNSLHNYVVPVVYGTANYSRFVPDGAYLNARDLGPKNLAIKMNKIIDNSSLYYDFFRWRNHYVYESRDRRDVCKLCEMLNDRKKMDEITVWNDFRRWWNVNTACY